jgi:peptide deformylase
VPGYYDEVERAERVRVRALDRDGKPVEFETGGLLAVCIQHEIDHLDGKLFVDYLSDLKRQRIRKKLEKEQREERARAHDGAPAI